PCLLDLVDDDRAASERIAAAHFDVRALPDPHRAANLSAAYSLVKACLEQHQRRIVAVESASIVLVFATPPLDASNARIHTPRPMTLMLESSSSERSLPTAGRESFA